MVEAAILVVGIILGAAFNSDEPTEVEVEKIKYVDIETYRTWGTTRLVPIGVREASTLEETERIFGDKFGN